jgi:hypothetical protein
LQGPFFFSQYQDEERAMSGKREPNPENEVQRQGYGTDPADQVRGGDAPSKRRGFGKDYGQGIGYGCYANEIDQRRSQTGAEKITRERGHGSQHNEDEEPGRN